MNLLISIPIIFIIITIVVPTVIAYFGVLVIVENIIFIGIAFVIVTVGIIWMVYNAEHDSSVLLPFLVMIVLAVIDAWVCMSLYPRYKSDNKIVYFYEVESDFDLYYRELKKPLPSIVEVPADAILVAYEPDNNKKIFTDEKTIIVVYYKGEEKQYLSCLSIDDLKRNKHINSDSYTLKYSEYQVKVDCVGAEKSKIPSEVFDYFRDQ